MNNPIRAQVVIDGDPRGLRTALAESEADLAKLDATGKKVKILEGAIQSAKDARAAMLEAQRAAQVLDEQLAAAKGAGANAGALKLLAQELKDANKEVTLSEAAWSKSRQQLDTARAAAAAAGVDTRNLAAEQVRLKGDLDAATEAVRRNGQAIEDARQLAQQKQAADRAAAAEEQRLAQIVEASLTRQRMAAQELARAEATAAQEAVLMGNKIVASQREAAAAAETLSNAFKQLGIRPLQEVVAETKRLQDALAQVRASGITSPEQQQAIAQFQSRLAALRAEAHGVQPATAAASAGVSELGRQAETAGGMIAGAARQVAGMAAAVVGLQGLTGLAKDVVNTGAAFETLEGRLSSLLGSSDKAKDVFAQIKELAKTTPFEVQGLTEAYVKLTAFGLQPSMRQMQSIADTAATLGGGTEALTRVTLALGQAWTKGKLQGDEILQLAEAGVPVWDLLATATGKNTAELQKMAEAGTLGRTVILKLIDALGKENMGASAKLMATFSGAVSNAHDALDEFYSLIAQSGVLEYLTKQIQSVLVEFDRMKASGELQAQAKAIADSFVKMAQGVKGAVDAVSAMGGVIKFALEAYVAWRVAGMTLIPMLAGVGAGAAKAAVETRAMGAAAATAAYETRALGVAAGTSASGIGLLSNGLRLMKGLTLVGLATEVVGLGVEFFRARDAAAEADKVMKKLMEPSRLNGPAKDIELVETKAVQARIKAEELATSFHQVADSGKSAGEALKAALEGAKFESPQGITDMLRGLDQIQGSARATGEEIRTSLVDRLKSMTTEDLRDFATMAEFSFGRGKISAAQLAFAIDTQLDAALIKAGVSASTTTDGMTAKFRETSSNVTLLVEQLDVMRGKGIDVDRVFIDMITKTLPQASSRQEFKFLSDQVEQVGLKAGLAKEEVDRLLTLIKQKADGAAPGINSLAEAFEKLGLKSRESLKQTEQAAKEAFDYIKLNGGTLAEQGAAWTKYSETAKAANNGILPPAMRLQDELYKIAAAGRQAGKDIKTGMDDAAAAVNKVRSDAEKLADRLASLKTQQLGDSFGNQSMGDNGSYEDMRRAGVTAEQMKNMGYSAREVEDYVNKNDQAAPGTVNRTVTTSTTDNYSRGIELGLTSDQAKVFATALSDEITRANVEARGKAQATNGVAFGVDDYVSYQRQAETKALETARRSTKKDAAASTEMVNSQFYGSTRTMTLKLVDASGKTTDIGLTNQASADALVRALQEAKLAKS